MIDVDDRTTWPDWLHPWATEALRRGSGRLIEEDEAFRARLSGTKLLAFHCTRLLDHELAWIRERGLRPLTLELVEERIRVAHERAHLDLSEHDRLLASNTFAVRDDRNRRDRVCLILGRGAFDETFGCEPLLSTWGGEAIYRYAGDLGSPGRARGPLDRGDRDRSQRGSASLDLPGAWQAFRRGRPRTALVSRERSPSRHCPGARGLGHLAARLP
jgi:hypothetical protein